jgi:phenylpyruvate tautomerase PptA (4-oxalocrotonate tautomerase family)
VTPLQIQAALRRHSNGRIIEGGNRMPLVRIDLIEGRSQAQIAAIGHAIQRALMDCLDVPERDQFQVIAEHAAGRLVYNPGYLGVERTEGIVIVQVFLSSGRSTAQKQAFYARAAELLAAEAATRPEDVTIVLSENTRADWSFGQGLAQYLVLPREQWK